jgi:hypothetical protein
VTAPAPRRATAFALAGLLLSLTAAEVAANHMQPAHGDAIVFDHRTGNEWWVEVQISGGASGSVSGVQAMDDGGPWTAMSYHPEWAPGDWAASFHIEPGHRVKFRALWSGGDMVESCWFTHPAGVEQCSDTTTTTTPPPPSGFTPGFTLVTGNEWWVQTQVTPNSGHTTASVDVRLNGGSWQPLKLQSWGVREYAASYHIVDGTVVQFRATDTAGASGLSGCYHWLPPQQNGETAAVVPCSQPPPAPTSFFVSDLKGNEWWIEAQAHSKSPIPGMDTRVNGGPWTAMTLRSWGAWAVSTHAPPGSHVQFRARFPDGTYAFLPNGYVWTTATQWPPPGSTFDARFENAGGNWNWVQVNVYASANWGLQGVSASVDGGPWQPLKQQAWGDWAAPIRADNGSYVRFRAESGATLQSGPFVWPSGRPVAAWPIEGSFASYGLRDGFTSPGGGYSIYTEATLRLTYHAGAWSGTCQGHTQESRSDGPNDPYVVYHDFTWTYAVHEGPPAAPTAPIVGASYNFHPLETSSGGTPDTSSCAHNERISNTVGMARAQTHLKDRDGHPLTLPVWWAHHDPNDPTPVADDLYWEPHLGLMVEWSHSQQDGGSTWGWMDDTDAPIR